MTTSTRSPRRSRRAIAAPAPVVTSDAAAPAADVPAAPTVDTALASPRRYRRTIGTTAAGDSADATPVRTMSLRERFDFLRCDPSPLMFGDAFLNVTPPVVMCDAPVLSPDALGYVPMPHTVNRASLVAARDLLTHAASIDLNPRRLDASAIYGTVPPALVRCAIIAYSHDRAMRSTSSRPVGYFDTVGVSSLDVAASLTRAALRLARLPAVGCGNRNALPVTIHDSLNAVMTRLDSLDA